MSRTRYDYIVNNTQQHLTSPEVPAAVPTWVTLLGEITVDNFTGTPLAHIVAALGFINPTSADHMGCAIIKIAHTVDSLGGRIQSTWVTGNVTIDIGLGRGHHAEMVIQSDGYIWLNDELDHWNEGDGTLTQALRLIRKYITGE